MIASSAPGEDTQKRKTPVGAGASQESNRTQEPYQQAEGIADKIIKLIGPAVLLPIPTRDKGPKIPGWQKLTLSEMTASYLASLEGGNIGVLLGAASGGLVSIDADSDDFLEAILVANPWLRESLITQGARGGNVWLRTQGTFPKSGKIKAADGSPWGEFRADGNQTVIYGTHPSGCGYSNNKKAPLCVEFATIKWPAGLRLPWEPAEGPLHSPPLPPVTNSNSLLERARAYVEKMPPAIAGQGGSDATFNVAKALCHDFALSQAEAVPIMQEFNARCVPPWSEKELLHKLADAENCNRANRSKGELIETSKPDYRTPQKRIVTISPEEPDAPLLLQDVEAPVLSVEALYGVAGEIIRKIEPHTEAHPAALLLQFFAGVGNMIGRGPYFITEGDKQHCNLFVCVVGDSSQGRKGTAWGRVKNLLTRTNEQWAGDRIKGGLASGEGVIAELKDPPKEDGEQAKAAIDKRLLLMEGEFGQVLQVMSRTGNTLNSILRHAWDSGHLNNMTKGSPLQASNCHISLIGHITREELRRLLSKTDASNGFANRFLYVHSARTKQLPHGGGKLDFTVETNTLREIVSTSQGRGEITRSQEADDYWASIYSELTQKVPGLWGEVTSRGHAQVVRLSLIFCLLDIAEKIEAKHIQAAKAVWDYCSQSARWAFEESQFSKDAQRILAALQDGPKTKTQITHGVFQRHITAGELDAALKEIEKLISDEKRETGGKPLTIYSLKSTGPQ